MSCEGDTLQGLNTCRCRKGGPSFLRPPTPLNEPLLVKGVRVPFTTFSTNLIARVEVCVLLLNHHYGRAGIARLSSRRGNPVNVSAQD